jgi:dihydrofolate reductase
MAIIGIVAIDRNGAIGKGGAIPWHFSADMKFFREQTTGNAVVMGYKTWLSLRNPLKDRLNIVMTRTHEVEPQEDVIVVRDEAQILSLKKYLACNLFIIGGEQIYSTFLDYIDRWIVTEIPLAVEGADAFVPPGYLTDFKLASERELGDGLGVRFYDRDSTA